MTRRTRVFGTIEISTFDMLRVYAALGRFDEAEAFADKNNASRSDRKHLKLCKQLYKKK